MRVSGNALWNTDWAGDTAEREYLAQARVARREECAHVLVIRIYPAQWPVLET